MQIKYRTARAGAITVHFRSVWNDRQGTHMKPTDKRRLIRRARAAQLGLLGRLDVPLDLLKEPS